MCWATADDSSQPVGAGSQPFVDGRDEHGRFVADGELVVSRGHGLVPLRATDPALDSVPLSVVGLVEFRRPTATGAELLAVTHVVRLSGMVQPIPRRRRWARFLRQAYALSARTRLGRVRGLPGPRRGTRMRPKTASNCGEPPGCPAVITIGMGFCRCSTATCSLVARPPRERPSPWSSGSTATPSGSSFCESPLSAPPRRAGEPCTP